MTHKNSDSINSIERANNDSIKSIGTNEDSQFLCSLCKSTKQSLMAQIIKLKDKAHQSFMQVLQIQQLHDEELQQLREDYDQKMTQTIKENQELRSQISNLKTQIRLFQKNNLRCSYQIQSTDMLFDNLGGMICVRDEKSYLDQSDILQFKDILALDPDKFEAPPTPINKRDKKQMVRKNESQELMIYIRELKLNIQQLKEKQIFSQNNVKKISTLNDSMKKQIKFMSEQVKRLASDKLRLQKKIFELQRSKPVQSKCHDLIQDICLEDIPKLCLEKTSSAQKRLTERSVPSQSLSGQFKPNLNTRPLLTTKQSKTLKYSKAVKNDPVQPKFTRFGQFRRNSANIKQNP